MIIAQQVLNFFGLFVPFQLSHYLLCLKRKVCRFDDKFYLIFVGLKSIFFRREKELWSPNFITVEPRLSGLGGTWVNSPDNRKSIDMFR